jgi:antitoxin component YwqK of YwqJK toxin-antitoxin module
MRFTHQNLIIILCFLYSLSALSQQPEYYANGQIKAEGKFKKGQKTGDWMYYSEDGKVTLKETYNRKAPNMKTAIFFHSNGKTKATGTFINNLKYEDWVWYREDGSMEISGKYMKNEPFGPLTYYDVKGNIDKKGSYRNNMRNGPWEYYHANGKISSKGNFKDDKEVYEWEYFDENGVLVNVIMYDEYANIQFYNPEKDKQGYATNQGKQPYKETYRNNNTKVEGQKNRGFNEGDWKWYYEDGTLKEEGSFKDHKQTGVWKTYYPNGNLHSQQTKNINFSSSIDLVIYYPDGNIKFKKTEDGKFTEFYRTGEIYSVETKVLGVSVDKDYFSKDGQFIKKEPYKFK